MTTNQELVAAAFVSEDAHKELGISMADALYESANRPGFVRTLVFHMNNHTVNEFTAREHLILSRIARRQRLHKMDRRSMIRQLRVAKCNA